MTSPDDRLAALFAADLPPARDSAFQAEVLAALVRRRFLADLMVLGSATVIGAAILWLIWPALVPVLEGLGRDLFPALTAAVVAASVLVLTSGRMLSPRS
jgi:hypothetical protein